VICQSFDTETRESAFLLSHTFDQTAAQGAMAREGGFVHLGLHATFEAEG
jgi:hypothetical protein